MAVMAVETQQDRIVCFGTLPDGRGCNQLLAHRLATGSIRVRVQSDVPIEHLLDGSVRIVCPNCGRAVHVRAKKAA